MHKTPNGSSIRVGGRNRPILTPLVFHRGGGQNGIGIVFGLHTAAGAQAWGRRRTEWGHILLLLDPRAAISPKARTGGHEYMCNPPQSHKHHLLSHYWATQDGAWGRAAGGAAGEEEEEAPMQAFLFDEFRSVFQSRIQILIVWKMKWSAQTPAESSIEFLLRGRQCNPAFSGLHSHSGCFCDRLLAKFRRSN